jgi:hypothetical protein
MTPAVRAVAAATALPERTVPSTSGVERMRVEDDDVGHRHEGDDAAADLGADRRTALRDLEEAVEGAPVGGGGAWALRVCST